MEQEAQRKQLAQRLRKRMAEIDDRAPKSSSVRVNTKLCSPVTEAPSPVQLKEWREYLQKNWANNTTA